MDNKSHELEVAIQAALEAGKVLEKYFETEILKEYKEDKSIVTKADKEAEELIKKIILENFPKHSVLGEETGMTENGCEYTWNIDPVDGTRNFANAIPLFAVSIALMCNKDVILGVVYNPATNSLFYAEQSKGAYLNGKQIRVSVDDRDKALITVSSGKNKDDLRVRRDLMRTLPDFVSSVRDFGCTSLDLAFVARGSTEADIKFGLSIYDLAAGILLVQEAGGTISKIDGGVFTFDDTSYIASNGVFHDKLVEEVRRQKEKLNIQ